MMELIMMMGEGGGGGLERFVGRSVVRAGDSNHSIRLSRRFLIIIHWHGVQDMLVADIAWRDEVKMLELQRLTREAVTGVPDALFTEVRPSKQAS
jgi:hypothetical protein